MIEQAVILCGGLGSRLGGLSLNCPKPLLPVFGRPFLNYLLGELGRQGYRDILLLAAYRLADVEAWITDNPVAERHGMRLSVSVEPERAGTGGALWHARDRLQEAFLLMNGDSYFDFSLGGLERMLLDDDGVVGVIALRALPDTSRYGVVTHEGKHILAFLPKSETAGAGDVNAGIYAFRRSVVDFVTSSCSLEADVLPRITALNRLRAIAGTGYFIDIGIPEDYARAQYELPEHVRRPALFLDRDGVLNVDHGYVSTIERLEWVRGAREAVRRANEAGWLVFVVTNQAGIGRGFYDEAEYHALMQHMQSELRRHGAHIDDMRHCPHHPEAALPHLRTQCHWRKPGAGMILDLLAKWDVDRDASVLIGDSATDIAAAEAAGLRAHLFDGGDLCRFIDDLKILQGPPVDDR